MYTASKILRWYSERTRLSTVKSSSLYTCLHLSLSHRCFAIADCCSSEVSYPEIVLRKYIVPNPPYRILFIGPRRCPVMIRLPWLGVKPSKYLEKKTRDAVRNAYYAAIARVISVYTTSCAFKFCKDRLPIRANDE